MLCKFCGEKIEDSARFCPYCGGRFEAVQQPGYTRPVPMEIYEEKRKPKLSVVIIAVVLVAAIAAGAFFVPGFLKKEKEDFETVGLINSAEWFDGSDGKNYKIEFSYDDNNNPVRVKSYVDGLPEKETVFEYDDNGNIIKETQYENGAEVFRCVDEYDADGNMTKSTEYENGIEKNLYIFETDSAGNVTKYTNYEYGQLVYASYTEYDENGIIVKSTSVLYENGEEGGRFVYEYNDKGDETKRLYYYGGELYSTYTNTYEYDAKGNCIKEAQYEDGVLYYNIINKYNENDICTEFSMIFYESNGEERSRFYDEYDDNGNTLKEIYYYRGVKESESTYEYDSNLNCIKLISSDYEENITIQKNFVYTEVKVTTEEAETIRSAQSSMWDDFIEA